MTALPGPYYMFRTEAQRARLHQAALPDAISVDPAAGAAVGRIAGCPIDKIALAPHGRVFRVDDRGRLFAGSRDSPFPGIEGPRVGPTARLVAGKERLWLLAAAPAPCRRLLQLDCATLHLLIDTEIEGLTDIAGDGREGLWLLARGRLRQLNERGAEMRKLPAPSEPASQIAAAKGRLALLSKDGKRLAIRAPESARALSVDLPRLLGEAWTGECVMLSGAGGAFLLHGKATIADESEPVPRFLLIDTDGNLLVKGSWRDDRPPAWFAASGADLFALFRDGDEQELKRFKGFARGGGQRMLTPALETESPGGTWLRAEVEAILPEDATLELRWVATDDENLKRAVDSALANEDRPNSARLDAVGRLLSWSTPFVYAGARRDPADPEPTPERFALPLHQAKGPILWIDVRLRSTMATAATPELKSLVVFHESQSLMDDLPAIYSGDGDRDRTLRRLVGVLEATTQDIDRRIGRLADRLDPERTDAQWLPALAAMLGLPFHDALSPEMRRNLVKAAPPILAGRGTRAGLLAMLGALFPGRPIRVADRTEQMIPLALGGGGRLPALLAGPSIRVPKLNARLVLKKTALCRTDPCADPLVAAPPQVLVAIPATWSERRRYGDALTRMIEAMIPAGVRLRLSWRPWGGVSAAAPDEVLTVLDAPEALKLGTGPSLGRAQFGGPRSGHRETEMRRMS